MENNMKKLVLGCSLLVCFISPLWAHDIPTVVEGLVNIQASANAEVETDTMMATVSIEAENYNPVTLAKNINEKMAWAIATSKKFNNVKVKGGQYSTHQLYNKLIFKAWRGRQTITLESKDTVQLGELIGLLQKKLLIKSLHYKVSTERLEMLKTDLMKQAIAKFRARADIVVQGFEAKQYVIKQININTNDHRRPVYRAQMMREDVAMKSKSAPATIQQSTSNINVNINGRIRIIK